MGESVIRILHLSDFHFRAETQWSATPVLVELSEAVGSLVQDGLAPDLVAMTGDIAFSGKEEEYGLAREWIEGGLLKALPKGFRKNRILIVPGNHDSDRRVVKTAAKATQTSLLDMGSQKQIAEILYDPDERDVLLRRHTRFLDFANHFRAPSKRLDVPWWSCAMGLKGSRVHIAGLCSSWMSWRDGDQGRLLIGSRQARSVLPAGSGKADVTIALVHHPWSSLAEFDERETGDLVRRKSDLVLRGHLHAQRSVAVLDPDNCCLELAAGSAYDGSQYANAFQLVEVDPGVGTLRVHFWTWRRGRWIPDRNAYENAPDGVATFSLDTTLPTPRPGGAASPAAKPADPVKYLRSMRDQTDSIHIRGLHVGSGKAMRLSIEDLYICLQTTSPDRELRSVKHRGQGLESSEPAGTQTVDLRQALEHPHLLVMGDPGSGKSTFLRRIAFELCRRKLGELPEKQDGPWEALGTLFPVLIPLPALWRHMAEARARKIGPLGEEAPCWVAHFAAAERWESGDPLDEAFFRSQM